MGARLDNLLQNENAAFNIPIDKLEYYPYTPFQIYTGDRKTNLINSIQENGLISPIIVTPTAEKRGFYTILVGANRVDAYKQLNYMEIETIVKYDLTEEAAMIIMLESNLFQRSIDEMLPSELAKALQMRHLVIKQQGKRNDLTDDLTSCQIGTKLEDEYKLTKRNMMRYIRLNNLCPDLLKLVDEHIIPFRAGAELSYLKLNEQMELSNVLDNELIRITIELATTLKNLSKETDDNIDIKSIIDGIVNFDKSIDENDTNLEEANENEPEIEVKKKEINRDKNLETITLKLTMSDIITYIPEADIPKIKEIILEALRMYYNHE